MSKTMSVARNIKQLLYYKLRFNLSVNYVVLLTSTNNRRNKTYKHMKRIYWSILLSPQGTGTCNLELTTNILPISLAASRPLMSGREASSKRS